MEQVTRSSFTTTNLIADHKMRRTSYLRHKLRKRELKYLFSNREEDVVETTREPGHTRKDWLER